MFDKEFFLNHMRNGESLDDLAQMISVAMNDAKDAFDAEVAAARKAENEAFLNQRKFDLAKEMVEVIREYGHLVAPEAEDILNGCTEDDLKMMVKTLDEMFNMMKAMTQLKVELEKAPTPKVKLSDDDVLANFIMTLA